MEIGKVLRKYREAKGLTQENVAYEAEINEKHYGKIEREEVSSRINTLEKICKVLDVSILDLFLDDYNQNYKKSTINRTINSLVYNCQKKSIDIHFNKNILIEGCNSCIWYNGFIGSMSFDEFELLLYADGNIKGKLFKNFKEVLELNSEDISNELQKYVKNDEELYEIIEYMYFDEEILNQKNGNVLFLYDSNWLSVEIVNNQEKCTFISEILDNSDIFEIFSDVDKFMDYIFLQNQ